MNDTTYIRYASPISNQQLLPSNSDIITDVWNNRNKEHYVSLYQYNTDHYKAYQESGSASGFTGALTNLIVFDFDAADPELARTDAKELFGRLIKDGLESKDIQVYWSGNKGYHIVIACASFMKKDQVSNIVKHLADGLDTADLKIYDEQRMFRYPLSLNKKSGLFKIPISHDTLFDLDSDSIKKLAASPKDSHIALLNNWNQEVILSNKLLELPTSEVKSKTDTRKVNVEVSDRPDFANKPKHITPAKYALQEGFFEPGERNRAYLILAALYRYLGYSQEIAYNMLKATDRVHVRRMVDKNIERDSMSKSEIWKTIIEPTYAPSWNGGTFSEKEEPLLIKTKTRYDIKDDEAVVQPVLLSELGGDHFSKYAKSFYESRILTGLKDLDEAMPICAGANVGIVGASGSGKTSITLEILKNMGKTDAISVFASLDMSKSRIYEKLLYKVTGGKLTRDQIYDAYIKGEGAKYDAMVKEMFPNVFIYSKSAPSVTEISNYIKNIEDSKGKPVRLLMIDYFERLGSEKSDDTAASKDVSSGIQDLISDFPMITPITLLQPNKFSLSGGTDKPISSFTAIKGSSFVYQALRNIVSIWRPFSSPEMSEEGRDNFIEMAILKNDLGECGTFKYKWEGKTGSILTLPAEAMAEYNDSIKRRKEIEQARRGEPENDF